MTLKRFLTIAAVILFVYAVAKSPNQYANAGKNLGGKAMEIADGIGTFLSALVS